MGTVVQFRSTELQRVEKELSKLKEAMKCVEILSNELDRYKKALHDYEDRYDAALVDYGELVGSNQVSEELLAYSRRVYVEWDTGKLKLIGGGTIHDPARTRG